MAVAEEQRFDEAALARYLVAHAPGFNGPLAGVQQFRGGQSNPTFLLTAADGGQYVLRRKPSGPLLPSAHAVDREFRVIGALHGDRFPGGATAVPVRGRRRHRHDVLRHGATSPAATSGTRRCPG